MSRETAQTFEHKLKTQTDADWTQTHTEFFCVGQRKVSLSPRFVRLRTKVWEEGGDDVKSAWPFDTLGNTRDTMAGTEGCQVARRSQSQKTGPSSDRSLQLDSLKPDSLVIGDQNAPVNTFSDLVLTIKAPSSLFFKGVKISPSGSSSERS